MSHTGNVLSFRKPEVPPDGPTIVNLEASGFVFLPIGDVRQRALSVANTHSGRNVVIQTLLVVARMLLEEYAESTGSTVTKMGMHRRNAHMRARELLELASELAALDVHPDEGSG